MQESIAELYPRSHQLEDGAKITCSLMTESDQQALSDFLGRLTRNDLLYLQFDVTNPEIQKQWFKTISSGTSICLCVYDPARLVGYASVQVTDSEGEIRVNISQSYQSRGLGRILTGEIAEIAKQLKLNKVTARMLEGQYGARSAFQRLGFSEQEILKNHVQLSSGETKDLLVMSRSLNG